jgi:formylglycine-generating enzyme required for sulfatase activity
MYTGNGGSNIRLAILAPEVQGDVPDYLPLYIQGLLNNNINKFSAVNLIDRQNLNRIIAEQNLSASGRFSDRDFVSIGNLTNAQYFLFGTIQRLSGGRYSLQLSVTEASTGLRRANFMKDGTSAQFEGNGTIINEATAELLEQLGVQLTAGGKQALLAGNMSTALAQAGLARGITAQAGGAEVEALFNFAQAITFDPSQLEALSRPNTLSTNISGGTVSQRILNDIQARDRWLEIFKETTRFYNDHPPFEIVFDPNLMQIGETNYTNRTANLGMRIALDPSNAGFNALNTLLEGLEKTGRRGVWGFSGWPLSDITPKTAGTVLFNGTRSFNCKVDVSLLNENNKTIGKSSVTLNSQAINISGNTLVNPASVAGTVNFSNIRAEDLTPALTIVIDAVNGIKAQNLNASGYMKIETGDLEKRIAERETAAAALPVSTQQTVPANMVRVEGGTFQMGTASGGDNDERPVHTVNIKTFYMGKHEVTQKEWREVMGTTLRQQRDMADRSWALYGEGDNYPMYYVNWHEAVEYCNKLSIKEGLTPAYRGSGDNITCNWNANGYRLPTEAEWEYAAKGGNGSPGNYTYSGSNSVDAVAWYSTNSGNSTHLVGTKTPNSLGIYDMSGNVWEWCWDWYGNYTSGSQTDPRGPVSGAYRVLRGGGWYNSAAYVRSAIRYCDTPSIRYDGYGFRLVRP